MPSESTNNTVNPLFARVLLCIVLLLLTTLSSWANATTEVRIDSQAPFYKLESLSSLYEDTNSSLTINDVINPAFDKWQSPRKSTLSFGYSSSTYWVRTILKNDNPIQLHRLVEIAYPHLDDLEIYFFSKGLLLGSYQLGDNLSFNNRPINHTNFLVPLDLAPLTTTTVYLRVKTTGSIQIPLVLWTKKALLERDQNVVLSKGIYFGGMVIMIMYNLMLFFVLKDKNFIFYVLYVACMAFFVFNLDGFSFKYFWPNATSWNEESLIISLAGVFIFALLFTRSFLLLPGTRPTLNKLLLYHVYAGVICIVFAFTLPYQFSLLITVIICESSILICMIAALIRWKDRYHAVKYYIVAWSFLIFGGLVLALNKVGLVPNNFLTQNAAQIGSSIEIVLLSIALANQINNERRLREEAQQESITAQAAAVESLKQYQELYDSAVQGLFLLDFNGHFLKVNPSVLTLLKAEESEIIYQKGLKTRCLQDIFPAAKALLGPSQGAHKHESFRVQGTTCKGDTIWIVLTLSPVYKENGKFQHYKGSMVDITESVAKEDALRERETAESAAAAKSAFLATMSHEIRTPMNGVIGMVEMLKSTQLDHHQLKYVNTIYNSGQALLGVINDILDYSKIENNKLEVETISVDLSEIIDECVSIFSGLCEEKNLQLYVDLDPNIPLRIFSDSTRIRQIILNLLSNAFKFTEQGYISIKADQLANDKIKITIQDTGIGLTEKEQDKLFKSFSQADSSTTRKYGGTGLGLAISKQLAELMGGEIDVVSTKGKGSSFWFTVHDYKLDKSPDLSPIKNADQYQLIIAVEDNNFSSAYQRYFNAHFKQVVSLTSVEHLLTHMQNNITGQQQLILIQSSFFDEFQNDPIYQTVKDRTLLLTRPGQATRFKAHIRPNLILENPVSPYQLTQAMNDCLQPPTPINEHSNSELNIQGMRFLVAEDNHVNQIVIKGILKKYGAEVQIASNGEAAFERFKNHYNSIDVVLMDIEMPLKNGYETTQAIRHYEQQHSLPSLPVFGLSAHALPEYMEKASKSGMNGFITKPITIKQLTTHLHSLNMQQKIS
ncbi:MAG: hypothetical protein CSA49_06285 [Gammaproteobacteria bacterium]|nr:MAG: hypothetical protein CSA49_06285 [Gammaproteobacteria bacterium]